MLPQSESSLGGCIARSSHNLGDANAEPIREEQLTNA